MCISIILHLVHLKLSLIIPNFSFYITFNSTHDEMVDGLLLIFFFINHLYNKIILKRSVVWN